MIRPVTKDDFTIVNELIDALMKESVYSKLFEGYKLTEKMFLSYTSDFKKKAAFLSIGDDDAVVGLSAFDLVPWLYHDAPIRIARLSYIYIKPEFRGQGYGKEIMKAFEYWGKSVGAMSYSIGHKSKGYNKVETVYMKEVN